MSKRDPVKSVKEICRALKSIHRVRQFSNPDGNIQHWRDSLDGSELFLRIENNNRFDNKSLREKSGHYRKNDGSAPIIDSLTDSKRIQATNSGRVPEIAKEIWRIFVWVVLCSNILTNFRKFQKTHSTFPLISLMSDLCVYAWYRSRAYSSCCLPCAAKQTPVFSRCPSFYLITVPLRKFVKAYIRSLFTCFSRRRSSKARRVDSLTL